MQTVTRLWDEHAGLAFPEVLARDKPRSGGLSSAVGGIGWNYLQRGGQLHPGHRSVLADCLPRLRFGYIGGSFEAHWYVVRLWKIAELISHDAVPLTAPAGAMPTGTAGCSWPPEAR